MIPTINPTLLIDILPDTSPQHIASCAAANVHRYRIRGVDLGWTASQQYDYAALDALPRNAFCHRPGGVLSAGSQRERVGVVARNASYGMRGVLSIGRKAPRCRLRRGPRNAGARKQGRPCKISCVMYKAGSGAGICSAHRLRRARMANGGTNRPTACRISGRA